ncbi:unnamed protein product, partial [Heterosigma akashiwo]
GREGEGKTTAAGTSKAAVRFFPHRHFCLGTLLLLNHHRARTPPLCASALLAVEEGVSSSSGGKNNWQQSLLTGSTKGPTKDKSSCHSFSLLLQSIVSSFPRPQTW